LSEGDVRLPKLFRQTVPQRLARRWQNSGHQTGEWWLGVGLLQKFKVKGSKVKVTASR